MQDFGMKEREIGKLKESLLVLNDKILKFQEYKKAKNQFQELSEKEKDMGKELSKGLKGLEKAVGL